MKKILLFALVMMCALPVAAQDNIRRIEGEIALGTTLPVHNTVYAHQGDGKLLDIRGALELRYNLRSVPVDVGLQFSCSGYGLRINHESPYRWSTVYMMAVADYNFRRNKNASFFVGSGVGVSEFLRADKFCVAPRCGVELWRHLRVTLNYHITHEAYSGFGLTVGVVFGGGNKK